MDEIVSYLKDADCSPDFISDICRLCENGDQGMAMKKLRHHRCILMDELHMSQRKVDCLDYILQRMSESQRQAMNGGKI